MLVLLGGLLWACVSAAAAVRKERLNGAVAVAALGLIVSWAVHTSVDWLHLLPSLTGVMLCAFAVIITGAERPPHATRRLAVVIAGVAVTVLAAAGIGRITLAEKLRDDARAALVADPAEAMRLANRALGLQGDDLQTLYVLAAADASTDDYRNARLTLLKAVADEPHNFVPHALLGDLAMRRGDIAAARSSYRAAIRSTRGSRPCGRPICAHGRRADGLSVDCRPRDTPGSVGVVGDSSQRALGGWLVLGARQALLTIITIVGVVALGRSWARATSRCTATDGDRHRRAGHRRLRARGAHHPRHAVATGHGARLRRAARRGRRHRRGGLLCARDRDRLARRPCRDRGSRRRRDLRDHADAADGGVERRLQFGLLGGIEVGQRLLLTIVAIALAAAGATTLAVPVAATAAGAAAYVAVLAAARWKAKPALGGLREMLGGYAAQWWQGRMAAQLAYAAYPVLGGVLLGAEAVGLLTLGLAITGFATLLAPLVARATFPAMAPVETEERLAVFAGVFRAFIVVSVPALVFVALAAEPLVDVALGPVWDEAVPVVRATCLPAIVGLLLTPSLPLLYLVLDPRRVKRELVGLLIGQWAFGAAGMALFGVLALPVASFAVAGLVVLRLDRRLRRTTGFSLVAEVARPLGAGGCRPRREPPVRTSRRSVGVAATVVAASAVYVLAAGSLRAVLHPRRMAEAFAAAFTSRP